MKILIAYATKSGTTRDAVTLLHQHLPRHEVTVADLSESTPDPTGFDHVILGSSIRMGKAHRALRSYLDRYQAVLCTLPHSLFLCCAFSDQFEHYLHSTFSASLLESAAYTAYFGGELNVSRQRGLDKLLTRAMRNSILEDEDDENGLPGLMPEHIRMLADRLGGK